MRAPTASSPIILPIGAKADVYASFKPEHLVEMLHVPAHVAGSRSADAMAARLDREVWRAITRELRGGRHRDEVVQRARDLVTEAIYDPDSEHHGLMRRDFAAGVARRTDVARRQVATRVRRFPAFDPQVHCEPTDAERSSRLRLLRECTSVIDAITDPREKQIVLRRLEGLTIAQVALKTGHPRVFVQAVLAAYLA